MPDAPSLPGENRLRHRDAIAVSLAETTRRRALRDWRVSLARANRVYRHRTRVPRPHALAASPIANGRGRRLRSCGFGPLHCQRHRRAAADRLIDHAITLGQLEQLIELVLRRVGVN